MKYLTIVTGEMYQENCYLVYGNNRDTFIIDPGDDFDVIDRTISQNKLIPRAILLTHGHFDHVGAVKNIKEKFNIPVYMNMNDEHLLSFMRVKDFDVDFDLKEINELRYNDIEVKCIHTPGHSNGSVCYLIDDLLFSGDTLFAGSIGRCDLPGGSSAVMLNTLSSIICNLDDNLTVLPGHGEKSTMAKEKTTNCYLKNL